MHFDPELDPEVREARERFIENRELQLQRITTESGESSLKFLFTANAGGAISVLTYLGAISQQPANIGFKAALALFFMGIILVGIYRFFITETYGALFWEYKENVEKYFKESLEWEDFQKAIEVKKNNIPRIFIYSSFVCFILGSIIGVVNLYA